MQKKSVPLAFITIIFTLFTSYIFLSLIFGYQSLMTENYGFSEDQYDSLKYKFHTLDGFFKNKVIKNDYTFEEIVTSPTIKKYVYHFQHRFSPSPIPAFRLKIQQGRYLYIHQNDYSYVFNSKTLKVKSFKTPQGIVLIYGYESNFFLLISHTLLDHFNKGFKWPVNLYYASSNKKKGFIWDKILKWFYGTT